MFLGFQCWDMDSIVSKRKLLSQESWARNLEVHLTREGHSPCPKEDDAQVMTLRQLVIVFHAGAHIPLP